MKNKLLDRVHKARAQKNVRKEINPEELELALQYVMGTLTLREFAFAHGEEKGTNFARTRILVVLRHAWANGRVKITIL